jgi:hypothetical protein
MTAVFQNKIVLLRPLYYGPTTATGLLPTNFTYSGIQILEISLGIRFIITSLIQGRVSPHCYILVN